MYFQHIWRFVHEDRLILGQDRLYMDLILLIASKRPEKTLELHLQVTKDYRGALDEAAPGKGEGFGFLGFFG